MSSLSIVPAFQFNEVLFDVVDRDGQPWLKASQQKYLQHSARCAMLLIKAENLEATAPHPSDLAVFLYPFSGVRRIKYLLAGNNPARSFPSFQPPKTYHVDRCENNPLKKENEQ